MQPHIDKQFPVDKAKGVKNRYRNKFPDTTNNYVGLDLILLWKGSCVKLIWHDFLVWIIVYSIISAIYRYWLFHDPVGRQRFELMCVYAERFSGFIPVTFLTGFYVSQVVNRWWDQCMSLPWPDKIALKLVTFCPGTVSYQIFYHIISFIIWIIRSRTRQRLAKYLHHRP